MADDNSKKEPPCDPLPEEQIDEALKQTFPASDPPPWTLGIEKPCPEPQEQIDVGTVTDSRTAGPSE